MKLKDAKSKAAPSATTNGTVALPAITTETVLSANKRNGKQGISVEPLTQSEVMEIYECPTVIEKGIQNKLGRKGRIGRNWESKKGLLYFKERLYLPDGNQSRSRVICHHHVQGLHHCGINQTEDAILSTGLYWLNMRCSIVEYVSTCSGCSNKPKTGPIPK